MNFQCADPSIAKAEKDAMSAGIIIWEETLSVYI